MVFFGGLDEFELCWRVYNSYIKLLTNREDPKWETCVEKKKRNRLLFDECDESGHKWSQVILIRLKNCVCGC